MLRLTKIFCCALALGALAAARAHAQGGPPMLTDDPGTPGNGNFELNIAGTIEANSAQRSWELPTFDLNYGLGDRIQLNLEMPLVLLEREAHGPAAGAGSTGAAVKWRFFEQDGGFSISTFPRVEWNLVRSSARRGLVEDGTRIFLPVEIARSFGPIDLDLEIGSRLHTVGRSEWDYGLVAGTALTRTLNLMAELHGSARSNFTQDRLTINVGLRQKFNSTVALIASLGRDVRSAAGEPLSFVGYCGVQLTF